MSKVSVVVLADTGSHEGMARAANGLITAKEFKQGGDQVSVIFDGAGTKWITALASPDHQLHGLYEAVKGETAVCAFCAKVFGVEDAVRQSGVAVLDEYDHHPSLRKLVNEGYQVITF